MAHALCRETGLFACELNFTYTCIHLMHIPTVHTQSHSWTCTNKHKNHVSSSHSPSHPLSLFVRLKTWKSHQPCFFSLEKTHSMEHAAYPTRLNHGGFACIYPPALGISDGFSKSIVKPDSCYIWSQCVDKKSLYEINILSSYRLSLDCLSAFKNTHLRHKHCASSVGGFLEGSWN